MKTVAQSNTVHVKNEIQQWPGSYLGSAAQVGTGEGQLLRSSVFV
jgi:hypothetical protein